MDKSALRKQVKNARQLLSASERQHKSAKIREHILHHPAYQASKYVAAYYPMAYEVDCRELLADALLQEKSVYLPVLDPDAAKELKFRRYSKEQTLVKNTLGFREPPLETSTLIEPKHLELVLVPMLAFDHQGHRLGSGGGYYDACFQYLRALKHKHKISHTCQLMGLAFDVQEIEALPVDPWDVPMDWIITESQVLAFGL